MKKQTRTTLERVSWTLALMGVFVWAATSVLSYAYETSSFAGPTELSFIGLPVWGVAIFSGMFLVFISLVLCFVVSVEPLPSKIGTKET